MENVDCMHLIICIAFMIDSKRIAEMHQGGMRMTSEGEGEGSTFSFWFPLFDAYPASRSDPTNSNHVGGLHQPAAKETGCIRYTFDISLSAKTLTDSANSMTAATSRLDATDSILPFETILEEGDSLSLLDATANRSQSQSSLSQSLSINISADNRIVNSSVLLVEDATLVRKLTRKTLEAGDSGNRVVEAIDGLHALEIVRQRMHQSPDIESEFGLILLDSGNDPLRYYCCWIAIISII